MKYIKEKPVKAEPRLFESAMCLPKGVVRDVMFSAKQRSDEKTADRTDDGNHSDPVRQAGDSSVNGVKYAGRETAQQAGDAMKIGHKQFLKDRQIRKDAKIAQAVQSEPVGASGKFHHENGRVVIKSQKAGARTAKTASHAAKQGSAKLKTVKAATKTANRSIQTTRRIAMEIIRTTARVTKITIKAGIAAAKAAVSAVKGLVSLIAAGGWVAIVVILVIAVIGWLLASPLSIFFAGNDSQSRSVQSVMTQLAQETADKIEAIRAEEGLEREVQIVFEGSEDGLMIQNGADILAVYSVRVSMDENNPTEIITIDENKEMILSDTYHRMVQISYQIIAPEDVADPGDTNGSKNRAETLEITINCKSYDEMIGVLNFSNEQVQMLQELMQPEYLELYRTLIGITQPSGLSVAEIAQIKASLPADLSIMQNDIVGASLSLVGKVNYFWGGKSTAIGWDNRWGTSMEVTAPGSSTTGTVRPFGLDCSGFVAWVYVNAGVPTDKIADAFGTNTSTQWKFSEPIAWNEAQIGDLAFFAVPGTTKYNHVGIIISIGSNGQYQVVHCASSKNQVVLGDADETGFRYIRRPYFFA